MQENQDPLKPLKDLISEWGISLPVLAKKINMGTSTFKNKFYRSGGKYDFTEEESQRLCETVFAFGKRLMVKSRASQFGLTDIL